MNRPSERWSRSSAVSAVSYGGRASPSAMPVPMRSVEVVAAIAGNGTHGLLASSIENTPSSPAASASRPACTVRAAERDGGSIAQNLCFPIRRTVLASAAGPPSRSRSADQPAVAPGCGSIRHS